MAADLGLGGAPAVGHQLGEGLPCGEALDEVVEDVPLEGDVEAVEVRRHARVLQRLQHLDLPLEEVQRLPAPHLAQRNDLEGHL